MAVSVSKPTTPEVGRIDDVRSLKQRVRNVTCSGSYVADGEVVTAEDVGLKVIVQVHAPGAVVNDTSPSLGNPLAVIIADDGSQVRFVLLESAADGDALDEKPAESNTTGDFPFRATFIGW